MKCITKKGFTLVELMIVIAIIGVLATALSTGVTKLMEYARTAKCKANLKNLMLATQNYSVDHGHYPAAGSFEWSPWNDWGDERKPIYRGERAWVAWTLKSGSGTWPWDSGSKTVKHGQEMARATFFGERAYISLTNGTLWELAGKDTSIYVCEAHNREAKKMLNPQTEKIYRSYVMNHRFRWDYPDGNKGNRRSEDGEPKIGNSWLWATDDATMDGRASIRLLFAEIPVLKSREAYQNEGGKYADSVLESNEPIGFNHFVGRKWVAHVVFLDGHVEGLILPSSGKAGKPDYSGTHKSDLERLTEQLCNATEIESNLREKMR